MAENKQDENKIEKQFGLTTLSLTNRTTVMVITFLIVTMGISTYINLPKESFPEIQQPVVYIGTPHPGNSPVDMENLITRPIEKELNTIADVDEIKSTSVQDYSTIIVEFTPDTEIEDALTKVKDAVDRAKTELPSDLESDPNVFEMNFSEFPVLNINLSGDYSLQQLNDYAEYLEDEIEKLTEISKVEIRGIDEKEVRINVDPYQMESRLVNFGDIENAVRAENITLSGGNLKEGDIRRSIRVVGEFEDPNDLLDVVIKSEKGNIVYLGDIAEVEFGYKEKQNYARLGGQPVVMVDVIKRSGENLLIATDKINVILDHAKTHVFPANLEVTITNDQSQQTRDMVDSLENNIISGVILVVIVLLFFLGSRNALFVGVAIPLSMFMSFLVLGAFGISINMMVLFSLIMALGMLVDNGIVVVENVYRLREEGYSAFEATKRGVGEVAWPIIASTATTLAAFLPLAFWPGIMGEFMKYLPITLMVTLGSSLFVALIINPVLIAIFMKLDAGEKRNDKKILLIVGVSVVVGLLFLLMGSAVFSNMAFAVAFITLLNVYVLVPLSRRFQSVFLPWIEGLYGRLLKYALAGLRPYAFFWGTVFLLFFSFVLMAVFPPEVEYFPKTDPKYVNVFIEFPVGTDVETTNTFAEQIEAKVMEVIKPYMSIVESVIANVGEGTADPNDSSAFGQKSTPNKARITVDFKEFKDRGGLSTLDALDALRNAMRGNPGVLVTVDQNADGPPAGKPISIEISGDNFETLINTSEQMKSYINNSGIEGIEKLKMDLETGKPELIVNIDREKARRFGLSTQSIAMEVRTALFGKEISKYKEGEDDYEIQLRLKEEYRYDVDALMNKSVVYRNQSSGKMRSVPISSVAKAELSSTYGSVRRKDLKRVVTLSSNVISGYNPTQINDQIKELLTSFDLPAGYEYKFGGEQEKQAKEMAFLSNALLIAVFFIFLIIVSQFNKITAPFIIMMSVVLSTIGVFLGLVIFGMKFSVVMTMIGIISLAGIVVNNAIVLIDFIELTRDRRKAELGVDKLPMEEIVNAIIHSGATRLRPVLLTAITTILGMIPLAVGINVDFLKLFSIYDADFFLGGDNVAFWGPMSWTIIYGLTFATFLTLIIVPVMYLFFAKVNRKLGIS
ncbi:efflux RND transporter permease subunit [Reichenbachiella carrageenanivorans]|uniref:Efflux RND transporter permease subunit n=1 Tax=Reichenbachiella carrageenanivorans TaxID=2979869 RepID=A0ABY6D014_9BACT|nr:efflux RND transporter permease subunit [Reichenbachiella carrageenanivorans]UXX79516.1 efflux RND transporter permease subunit [Reichenbachiella carrageenanivorans]